VEREDFIQAIQTIIPSSHRSTMSYSRQMSNHLIPLLSRFLMDINLIVNKIFPIKNKLESKNFLIPIYR
jgi:hypothetical protein